MRSQHILLSLLLFCACVNSAKILGIFPMPAPSHFSIGFRIMRELADRGHQVSFINPFPQEKPIKNYRDISVKGVEIIFADLKKQLVDTVNKSPLTTINDAYSLGNKMCEYVFASEAVQNLLKSNERFDLVIIEDFLIPSLTALSVHFNAPFIYVSSVGANVWNNHFFGNPAPVSYVPHQLTRYTSRMSFFQRLYNLFITTYDEITKHQSFYSKQNEILHKYLPDAPHLNEIIYNATLILLNSHTSVTDPVPHLPNMIEIAGFHVEDTKTLPSHLQTFLDDASEGVVYFSMGSNLRSADLHISKREALVKTFAKLKQKVLWKFETDDIKNLPANVKIEKWLPQSAVLAHPNVRVFISHGGMLSNLESVYHGVPIIGIPVFADQYMNINTAVNKGYAVQVSYDKLSEETLSEALNEILYNNKYTENVKRRSKLLRDQPVKPIDLAIYWVEYAIRNRGYNPFKSAALDLPWYKLYMWDITFFLLTITASLVYVVFKVIKKVFKFKSVTSRTKKNQ